MPSFRKNSDIVVVDNFAEKFHFVEDRMAVPLKDPKQRKVELFW